MTVPVAIVSRDNPLLVQLRRLLRDGAGYRRGGRVWLEGDHLCGAARAAGWPIEQVLLTEAGWQRPDLRRLAETARRIGVLPPALWREISELPSPAAIGFVARLPTEPSLQADIATVVLDRLQDPGNAGSLLRSAAALGVRQVIALKGTVALWSPKVLRAGMGAHFALALHEGADAELLARLALPLLATSSHAAQAIDRVRLPTPAAWVFGHEGQGVAPALLARCAMTLRIPQPGGQESLNVAAAAAICLYESARQRRAGAQDQ